MAEKLYRFHWDCGRMGDVTGIFVADEAKVVEAIGKCVYFGEILGKHSEVQGTLTSDDLTVLTGDADFIAKAKAYGLVPSGYNPLAYMGDDDGGDY